MTQNKDGLGHEEHINAPALHVRTGIDRVHMHHSNTHLPIIVLTGTSHQIFFPHYAQCTFRFPRQLDLPNAHMDPQFVFRVGKCGHVLNIDGTLPPREVEATCACNSQSIWLCGIMNLELWLCIAKLRNTTQSPMDMSILSVAKSCADGYFGTWQTSLHNRKGQGKNVRNNL